MNKKVDATKKTVVLDATMRQELTMACLKDKPLLVACGNREQAKRIVERLLTKIERLELDGQTTIQGLVTSGSLLLKIPLTKHTSFRSADEQAIRTLFGLAIKEKFYKKIDRFKIELKE